MTKDKRHLDWTKVKLSATPDEPEETMQECEDCGYTEDIYHACSDLKDECPECGSSEYLICTNIEGIDCERCGQEFGMWDEYYSILSNGGVKEIELGFVCTLCEEEISNLKEESG